MFERKNIIDMDTSKMQVACNSPCLHKCVIRFVGLVRNSPNRLDPSYASNDPRSPARGNERAQQTGRILAVL